MIAPCSHRKQHTFLCLTPELVGSLLMLVSLESTLPRTLRAPSQCRFVLLSLSCQFYLCPRTHSNFSILCVQKFGGGGMGGDDEDDSDDDGVPLYLPPFQYRALGLLERSLPMPRGLTQVLCLNPQTSLASRIRSIRSFRPEVPLARCCLPAAALPGVEGSDLDHCVGVVINQHAGLQEAYREKIRN